MDENQTFNLGPEFEKELGTIFQMTWWKKIKRGIRFFCQKRGIRFFCQRRIQGWDDSETWSLDCALAKHILPRLKRFRELSNGYPGDLTEQSWNEILDKMIRAFELKLSEWDLEKELPELKIDHEVMQEGFELFGKYYRDLWW